MSSAEELVDELPSACIVFDQQGKLTFANKHFVQLVGTQAVGSNIEEFLTVSSRIFYQTHLFPLLAMKGQVSEIFLTLKSSDGAHLPIMLNGRNRQHQDGNEYICVLSTVWERQKYESELINAKRVYQTALEDNQALNDLAQRLQREQQQLDRKVTELLRRKQEYLQLSKVLMHDMQEPVRKIGFYFNSILSGDIPESGGDRDAMMKKIERSVTRLRELTDAVQRFVSIEDDQQPLQTIQSDALAQQAASAYMKVNKFSEFVLHTEGSVAFQGRPRLLTTLFYELIANAVRFKKDAIPLQIQVRSIIVQENIFQTTLDKYLYTDHVQIQVTDNGQGFEQRFASYIFGLFNKLETNTDGVGLGLALCEQIVSQHFGSISAFSEEGIGTSITVTLPVQQPGP